MTDPFPPRNQILDLIDGLVADSRDLEREPVVPTGLEAADEALDGGLRGGQVCLIAGIAGVGTSVFALGIARNAALHHDQKTVLLAPDSSEREILLRLIASETKVPVSHLRSGRVDERDIQKIERHREALLRAPIFINAGWTVPNTTDAILDSVRIWMADGVRLVIVDGTSGSEPRTRQLVKELKLVAQAYRAAVVIVSKAVLPEHRRGDRPVLGDLREYAAIADLVDVAMMLHRDEMQDRESTRPGEADLEILKHRYGPPRQTMLAFHGHYASFADMLTL